VALDGIGNNGTASSIFTSLAATQIPGFTGGRRGGDITIQALSLTLTNGAQLGSNTEGRGNASNVRINAHETVTFDGVSSNGCFSQKLCALGGDLRRHYSWIAVSAIALLLSLGLHSCMFFRLPSTSQIPFKADPKFELASTAGIDYQPLQALLGQHQWKAADRETFHILLKISAREAEGWLSQTDVENLDCADLETLAQLWDYYSDGRFGFRRQQQIWESLGGIVGNYTPQIAEQFGDRVGWRKQGQWLKYDQLNFSDSAQEGHLPATTGNGVSGGVWNGIASITHQLKYCPLIDALANRQWVKADIETLTLFDAYRFPKEKESDLDPPAGLDLEAIPCHELKAVDKLWLKYSDGRFGLSVQTPILKATGNAPKEGGWERYEKFEEAVGWWSHTPDVENYDRADPKTLPQGHFPYRLGYDYTTYGSGFIRKWRLYLNPDCGFY
jgi:hypothetical protein